MHVLRYIALVLDNRSSVDDSVCLDLRECLNDRARSDEAAGTQVPV